MMRHEIRWLSVEGHRLGVVERVTLDRGASAHRCWLVACRTPVAIIVQQAQESITLGMDGERLDPGALGVLPWHDATTIE